MKVIDLQLFRSRRAIAALEQRVAQLAITSELGTARQIKSCFKEWLEKTRAGNGV